MLVPNAIRTISMPFNIAVTDIPIRSMPVAPLIPLAERTTIAPPARPPARANKGCSWNEMGR
ncbi:hypothetical protein D3C73_745590 [compost metagenome]